MGVAYFSYYTQITAYCCIALNFIHYGIYVGTFWYRNRVNYGVCARRRVVKACSWLHLCYHYTAHVWNGYQG